MVKSQPLQKSKIQNR